MQGNLFLIAFFISQLAFCPTNEWTSDSPPLTHMGNYCIPEHGTVAYKKQMPYIHSFVNHTLKGSSKTSFLLLFWKQTFCKLDGNSEKSECGGSWMTQEKRRSRNLVKFVVTVLKHVTHERLWEKYRWRGAAVARRDGKVFPFWGKSQKGTWNVLGTTTTKEYRHYGGKVAPKLVPGSLHVCEHVQKLLL